MSDPTRSTPERTEECSTCRFWKVVIAGGSYQGQCKRHAPTRNVEIRKQSYSSGPHIDAPGNNALWPLTRKEDWCGEFNSQDEPIDVWCELCGWGGCETIGGEVPCPGPNPALRAAVQRIAQLTDV